jgi:hypothetical protein
MGCAGGGTLRAAEAASPQDAPPHLDQRMFLRASYLVGQDIDEVWRPTGLVSGYERGPERRNIYIFCVFVFSALCVVHSA